MLRDIILGFLHSFRFQGVNFLEKFSDIILQRFLYQMESDKFIMGLVLELLIKCPVRDACLHIMEILAVGSGSSALSFAYISATTEPISFKFGMCI